MLLFRDLIILYVNVGIVVVLDNNKYNRVGICFKIMMSQFIQTRSLLAMLGDLIAVVLKSFPLIW